MTEHQGSDDSFHSAIVALSLTPDPFLSLNHDHFMAPTCVPVAYLHCLSCVLGRFDGEAELITAPSPPFPDHPDIRYSGHSFGDTRGPLGTGPAAGLIPVALIREMATEHKLTTLTKAEPSYRFHSLSARGCHVH